MNRILIASFLCTIILMMARPGPAQAMREWTVCVYACCEDEKSSGIEEAMVRALRQAAELGTTAAVDFCAQVDSGKWTNDYIKSFYPDGGTVGATRIGLNGRRLVLDESLGEVNMGRPDTLWNFLKWVARDHRAKNYLLVFSGHGSGVFSWRGTGGTNSADPGQVVFNPDAFVCYEDNDCLTVLEIRAVFEAFRDKLNQGRPLTVVAFDSCLAGTIETLYEFRSVCQYVIASATTIPMSGFDYQAPFRALRQNPRIHPDVLCEVLVKAFIHKAAGDNSLAAWRMDAIPELAGAVDRLAIEIVRGFHSTGGYFSIDGGLFAYSGGELYWDIAAFAKAITSGHARFTANGHACHYPRMEQLVEAADYVRATVTAARTSLWYSGDFAEARTGGLSVALPAHEKYDGLRPFYHQLSMSRDLHWINYLECRSGRY